MDNPSFESVLLQMRAGGHHSLVRYVRALARRPEAERTRRNILREIAPCRRLSDDRQTLLTELKRQRMLKQHRPHLYGARRHLLTLIAYGAECQRLRVRQHPEEA